MSEKINGAPRVTDMKVIPVAGQDSMLLNLSGAHAPFFTRNVVILTDTAGHIGVGEVPGGEKIRRTLEELRDLVVGQRLGDWNTILAEIGRRFGDRVTRADAGCRPSTCASRCTAKRRWNAPCSICWASIWTFRSAPCWAKASSAARWRCWAICSSSATARRPTCPIAATRRKGRRLDPPARRRGPDAGHGGAPGRSGARTLRLSATSSSRAACCMASRRWKSSPAWRSAFPRRASRSIPTAPGR